MKNLKWFNVIEVKYLPPTDKHGARLKLTSQNPPSTIIISYDFYYNSTKEMAQNWLEEHGFELIGVSKYGITYLFFTTTNKSLR